MESPVFSNMKHGKFVFTQRKKIKNKNIFVSRPVATSTQFRIPAKPTKGSIYTMNKPGAPSRFQIEIIFCLLVMFEGFFF